MSFWNRKIKGMELRAWVWLGIVAASVLALLLGPTVLLVTELNKHCASHCTTQPTEPGDGGGGGGG